MREARSARRDARARRRPQLGARRRREVRPRRLDLRRMDFGETNAASRIVYSLVGLAAVYGIASLLRGSETGAWRSGVEHRGTTA